MSKTKIAFFINFLRIGGIEKALLNLVKKLPKDKFDITIYVGIKDGGYLEEMSKFANIKQIPNFEEKLAYDFRGTAKKYIKKFEFIKLAKFILQKIKIKSQKIKTNFLTLSLKNLDDEYDVAVAYQVPISAITLYVAEKVKANKKILWSHCDIASVGKQELYDYIKYMKKFDYIVSVSEDTNQHMKDIVPTIADKCIYLDNVIDEDAIKGLSNIDICDMNKKDEEVSILTVARLADGKGYDLAIDVTEKLISNGHKIKWFAIGEGEERKKLEQKIEEKKLKNYFILLGERKNPYPYFKKCDIYVQPSTYEGVCIARLEAKILNKPIITTNTGGTDKYFKNKVNAIITEYNVEEIYNAIIFLMEEKNRDILIQNSKESKLEQKEEFYTILERK